MQREQDSPVNKQARECVFSCETEILALVGVQKSARTSVYELSHTQRECVCVGVWSEREGEFVLLWVVETGWDGQSQ